MAAPRLIVFSHANGFPAGTYRQLFEAWRAAGCDVMALPRFGHDPQYPVSNSWPHLWRQLADYVRREAPGRPAWLVGHSLGGFLSLMAACHTPDIAAGVVLLDSPVLAGWRAHSLRMLKATRLVGRVSPGRVSQRRRYHWPSLDEARRHLGGKHVFARWAPGVLDDYLAAGLEPAEGGGLQLAFNRDVETRLYNTLPHQLGPLLHRHPPRCPVHFVGGTQSVEVRQVGMEATRAVTRGHIAWIEGSHLFPMEKPAETAQAVLQAMQAA